MGTSPYSNGRENTVKDKKKPKKVDSTKSKKIPPIRKVAKPAKSKHDEEE